MIPVTPAPEPANFDRDVRQPGLRALTELVLETKTQPKRKGRPRKNQAKYRNREEIPSADFPKAWRCVLEDLREAYRGICSYCCLFIERGTGDPTVDHYVPVTRDWRLAYEWRNYRLACSRMNTNKGQKIDVLDPFEVKEGWFGLDLVEFQVLPGPLAEGPILDRVRATIARLKLDRRSQISRQLETYHNDYQAGHITLAYLKSRAPFLAAEMHRQGKLLDRDF